MSLNAANIFASSVARSRDHRHENSYTQYLFLNDIRFSILAGCNQLVARPFPLDGATKNTEKKKNLTPTTQWRSRAREIQVAKLE